MSGIVISGNQGNPFASEKAETVRDYVHEFLSEMNQKLFYEVFGFRERALNRESAYTGSFGYYLKNKISGKSIGDIDVIVPAHTQALIEDYFTVNGIEFKRHGTQISAILTLRKEQYQTDFQFKEYKDHEPTEFARFSNSWHSRDAAIGLKGAFHKMLLSSLTAAWGNHNVFSVQYGLRSREPSNNHLYVTNLEEVFIQLLFGRKTNFECQFIEKEMHAAFSEMKFYNFQGVLELACSVHPRYGVKMIIDKFYNKLNQKPIYSDEQIQLVNELVSQTTGIAGKSECKELASPLVASIPSVESTKSSSLH